MYLKKKKKSETPNQLLCQVSDYSIEGQLCHVLRSLSRGGRSQLGRVEGNVSENEESVNPAYCIPSTLNRPDGERKFEKVGWL